jgi:hypothetical protein
VTAPLALQRAELHRARRGLLAAAGALSLAGCMSIPVSTLWRLRSFDIDDLLALNPADLRAAVLSDPRVRFAYVDLNITLQLKAQAEERTVIRLDALQKGDARLERAADNRRWTIFALDAAGIAAFDRLRQGLARARGQSGGSLTLGVSTKEAEVPPDLATRLPLRLDLLLDSKEGWFTLLRETTFDSTKAGEKGRS